jgi:preprotein translocase subunit SecD
VTSGAIARHGLTGRSAILGAWVLCIGILIASVVARAAEQLAVDVAQAEVAFDRRTGEPMVAFALTESSRRLFAELTARNVGRALVIRVDGRVLSKPVVREPILGGAGQISGGFSVDEAKDIAGRLSSGAAKLEFEAVAD